MHIPSTLNDPKGSYVLRRVLSLPLALAIIAFAIRTAAAQSGPLLLSDAPGWAHYFCDSSEPDPNGSATLQGAHCYPSLTVPSGATITITDTHATPTASDNLPRGEWLAFVNGPCTIAGTIKASSINYEYANGGGSGGGGGGAAANISGIRGDDSNMFGGANYVVTGTTYNNPDFSVIHAAAGGSAGAIGQNGGIGTTPTSASQKWSWMLGDQLTLSGAAGGPGGNGTSAGGSGGYGGGGVVLVCANSINFTGTIDVSGANGLPGPADSINAGGGGGGGGGVVLMATSSYVANSGTIILNGGIGGSAQSGAGSGGNGGAGWSKQFLFGTFTPTPTTILLPLRPITATLHNLTPLLLLRLTHSTATPTLTPTPTLTATPTITPTPAPVLSFQPSSVSFGSVKVNQTASIVVQLTNLSAVSTVHGRSITVSGPFTTSNACGSTVAPGATCNVTVKFKPTSTSATSGTVTFTDDASGSPQIVTASGTGS